MTTAPQSHPDDPQRASDGPGGGSSANHGERLEPADQALRAALRYGIAGLIALVLISCVLATIFAGLPGLWGAVIGSAIGGFFILTTAALVLFSARLETGIQGMVMLGSWVGKLLVVLVVVAVLKRFDFYDRMSLFLTVVGALLVVLGAETYGVLRQRVPVVTPPGEGSGQDRSKL